MKERMSRKLLDRRSLLFPCLSFADSTWQFSRATALETIERRSFGSQEISGRTCSVGLGALVDFDGSLEPEKAFA